MNVLRLFIIMSLITINMPLFANSTNPILGYQFLAYILIVLLLFIFVYLLNILIFEFLIKRGKHNEHSTS